VLERGRVLDGRFQIENEIGHGGAAVVYRARDRLLQRPVAVKVLHGRGVVSSPEKFAVEARALAKLHHPHILEIFEVSTVDGAPFLVTEFAERGSLFVHVPKDGLPREQVRRFARQTEGVVHRDVKPENVLLLSDSICKLGDFGLARFQDEVSRVAPTASGLVLGTPEYLAPEVLRGERAEAPSDLYAWACVVYFMATGRPPHEGDPGDIYRQRVKEELDLEPLHGRIRTVVHEAMAQDPLARPSSVELLDDLGGEVSSQSISMAHARVQLPSEEVPARPPRLRGGVRGDWRQLRGLAWGLGAMLGGLGVGFLWSTAGTTPPPPPPTFMEVARADPLPAKPWIDRLSGVDVQGWIEDLHDIAVGTPGEQITSAAFGQPQVLATLRAGGPERRRELTRHAARLPLRQEFRQAVPSIEEALLDRRAPRGHRLGLYEALRRLGHLDAYLHGTGELAPYQVAPVMARYLPLAIAKLTAAETAPAPAARDKDPAPGHYELFRWARQEDQKFPYLFPPGERLAPPEIVQIGAAQGTVGAHAWTLAEHRAAVGRIHLEDPGRYGGARLMVDFANLVAPHVLRIHWNDVTIDYHPDPALHPDILWTERPTWWRLRARVPVELLEQGWNRVRVETTPLLGLPRWEGVWIGAVEIQLEP
jgi:serine/threonine-protein kinase